MAQKDSQVKGSILYPKSAHFTATSHDTVKNTAETQSLTQNCI